MQKIRTYANQLNITSHIPVKKSTLTSKTSRKIPKVSAKFIKILDRVIQEHEDVLQELAKR